MFIKLPKYVNLDDLLTTKFYRTVDNAGCFSFYNKKFQVISKDILPKRKVTILMSKKIGIKVEYNGKKYDVITCEDLPTHNSYKNLNYFLILFYQHILMQFASKFFSSLLRFVLKYQ